MKKEIYEQSGFTLIELVVVFTIIGIMTALGIASFSSFNGSQSVQVGASDVSNMISTAKSRSISQVKPPQCVGKTLNGYQVNVTALGPAYTLSVICGGTTYVIDTKDLPFQVTFANGSTASVLFAVSTGSVSAPATITVSGYGRTKVISVSTTGNISVN